MTEDSTITATLRDQVSSAVDKTRDGAKEAVRISQQGIEANPLTVLLGGLAVGIVAGALIPASQREKKALGPMGKRVNATAMAAAAAARDAGKEQLGLLTPDAGTAKTMAGNFIETVLGAAKQAGAAAAKADPTP